MKPKIWTFIALCMIAAMLLTSCLAPAPSVQVVVETVVVEKEVEKIVEKSVEVMVTPTPVPPPIKSSGPVFIGSGGMTGKHYNPLWMTSNPQFLSFPLILPALTWFNDKVQPVPDLASKVEVNEDATVYTFTLPESAVWSDGQPLTAKDVIFTYQLAVHPAIGQSVWVNNFANIKGMAEFKAGTATEVSGLTAVDDHTVRFELVQPNASFLFNTYLGILPEHILGQVKPEDLEKEPYVDNPTVTSGPYDFVSYEPGQYIQLKKKDNYWGKQVSVDEVYIKLFEAAATQLAQLEAGELHLAIIPADEVARFRTFQHVDVLTVQGIGYYVTHFEFRTQDIVDLFNKSRDEGGKGFTIAKAPRPYMQDKRFRQALAYAVDRSAVIKVVAGGEATPIYSSIFGPEWAINPDLETYERNLDKAKALMQEVGVTFAENGTALWEGKSITLVFLSNTSEEARKLGEVLQQQFGQVGIRLDIKLVTSAAFLQAAYNGEGDLIRNAGGRFGADPSVSSLYYTCKAGWAESVIGYCNPQFDELMAQGVATSVQEERQKVYWEASAILNDELPSLFYYTPSVFVGVNKGLTGLKPSADPGYLTWNIEEWAFSK